jgi:hypothetical protein
LPPWDKDDPTDLEELAQWTTRIMALAIVVIVLVVLAFVPL